MQRRLAVTAPDDPSELEADRVVDSVMAMRLPAVSPPAAERTVEGPKVAQREAPKPEGQDDGRHVDAAAVEAVKCGARATASAPILQRQEDREAGGNDKGESEQLGMAMVPVVEEDEEEGAGEGPVGEEDLEDKGDEEEEAGSEEGEAVLHKRAAAGRASDGGMQGEHASQRGDGLNVTGDIERRLAGRQGGGSPLPEQVRSFMEPRFGVDLSGVRVHAHAAAAQMAQDLGAQAFTHGRDVYMGEGSYSPDTDSGKRLLAHELTHVLQQTVAGQGVVTATREDAARRPVLNRTVDRAGVEPSADIQRGSANGTSVGQDTREEEYRISRERDVEELRPPQLGDDQAVQRRAAPRKGGKKKGAKAAKPGEPKINTADELRGLLEKDPLFAKLPRYPYGGEFPGPDPAKDGYLYFDKDLPKETYRTAMGTMVRQGGAKLILKAETKKQRVVKIVIAKLVITVGPGSTRKELASTIYHENIHAIHHRAKRSEAEKIAEFNAQLYNEIWGKWFKSDAWSQQEWNKRSLRIETEIPSRLTKQFGVDISPEANSEVLAYAEQFKWTLSSAPEIAAETLTWLLGLRQMDADYGKASAAAREKALGLIEDGIKANPKDFRSQVLPKLRALQAAQHPPSRFFQDLSSRPGLVKLFTPKAASKRRFHGPRR
jgi:hypothetical protein